MLMFCLTGNVFCSLSLITRLRRVMHLHTCISELSEAYLLHFQSKINLEYLIFPPTNNEEANKVRNAITNIINETRSNVFCSQNFIPFHILTLLVGRCGQLTSTFPNFDLKK